MASKKRTGLDALNEYEAQSGRGTQSTGQQDGGSFGAWRSGLDLLREYEANGGGQNVKNGPYNPDYRTVTSAMRQAQNDAYAEAYEKYKKIYAGSQARARQQQRIADTSNRDVDTDILTSRRKEQESLFRKYQQAMDAAEGRERQTRRIMDAGDEFGAEPNANAQALRDGWQSSEQRMRQAAARQAAAQDQARGQQRTAYELGKQLDQMEKARDYQLAQQADDPEGLPQFKGAYDAVNAGREKPMTLTEMEAEIGNLQYRKSKLEKSVKGRVGEYAVDLGRGVFKGGFEQWATGFESAMSYLEQGANGAAAWALRDLAKAVPAGSLKNKMLSLADDFESYWTGESTTEHERLARQHRDELQKLETEMADKYKGAALWVQQQMPSAGNMLFGAGVSAGVGVNNLATLGVTAGGSSALEAKDNGATDAQALAYGVVAGGLEVFSEKLFGGNPIYDKDAGLVNKAVSKLTDNKTIMKILNSKAFDIASEGLEEVVTEILDPVAEWAIYNGSNTEFADAESIGNAFLGGVFLSVVGNVVDAPAQIRQARYERVMNAAAVELADIAQTMDSADVQEAAQVIRDKIAYGVTPDAADIGAVLDAMSKEGEAVDTQAVQAAVERSEAQAAAEDAAAQESVFQQFNAVMDAQERAQRNAERVSEARSEETTEAINESEAASAQLASELLMEQEAKDAQTVRGRLDAEEARTDAAFDSAVQQADAQTLRDAAARYGYGERMTNALVSGYDGTQDAAQYTERMNAAYEYGKNGMSLTAAQRAAQDIDAASVKEAWSAGREIVNAEETGSTAADDGGQRNAGMDPGEPSGAVAGRTGGTAARSAGAERVKERIELENRVRAAGAQYLSGKDIGLPKGSERRSFREAAESTWTDEMRSAAQTLRSAGFSDVHFTVGAISVENQKAKVTRYADGAAIGNTVWVNATATKWTVTQLANHEAFHRQVQDAPYLLDFVRAALVDELGEDGIAELAQRYAEAYEGCYGAEDIDAYVEEICADAYAGMDRLPEAKTEIMQKAARQAQDAQRTAEKYSVETEHSSAERYRDIDLSKDSSAYTYGFLTSLEDMAVTHLPEVGTIRDADGKIDKNIVIQMGMSNAADVGAERSGKVFVTNDYTGRNLRIDNASIRHGLNGDLSRLLTNARLGAVIGDVVKHAVPINALKDKARGVSGTYAMAAYATDSKGREFVAVVTIEQRSGDVAGVEAYDVTHAVSGRQNKRSERVDTKSQGVYPSTNASKIKISDFLTVVKNTHQSILPEDVLSAFKEERNKNGYYSGQVKFSAAEETTPQENDKTALSYFGRTYKWSETGYVLLNGARLDFSGRHEGGSGGYRSVDHRDIIDALGEDYGGDSYTGGMVRFMQEGNIRISPESGGINLAVMPTKAQMDSLSDFISKERGEVILDIDDASGNTISSTEYPRGTHANKVLQDIRNYFNDGTLPEVSDSPTVGQFRYSVTEDAGADETADAGTQELLAERERLLAEEDARIAAEEAAKEPAAVYESLTMDSMPKKAQDYLKRVQGRTAAAIQQTLSMPFAARQEVLKPALGQMMNEYLQTGRITQETIDKTFEDSYAKGVELDTEFYDQYKDVKTRLRDMKVTLSEADRADIADYDDFRRAAFGRLRIANEGGVPVDTAYQTMREMAPELFPASVTHPADQLMKMFDVAKRIQKVERSLDEAHGENAEEFKRWAKNDYEASVEGMLGALRTARRYAEARMRQKQARAVPTTQEEVTALWQELKKLRRTYERASAKNLMTAEDNAVLNRLLRGELAPEDVRGMENADGILAMYEAKADYDVAAAKLADWQRYRKGRLLDEADSLLQNAEQAKDKPNGFLYARETMTRNVRDIFPEADAAAINRTYFEPVRRANADANKMKNRLREQVAALNLSRKAAKGDAVSEAHAVQLLGEAQDNIRYLEKNPRVQDRDGKTLDEWRGIVQELWKTSPGLDKAKIESAVESFRKIYDGLFEQMNEVRIRNGYEPINYRRGYFPHFQPGTSDGILSLMGKALGIDAEVTALPTTISGLTHTFKPGITYFGHALERIGFDTAYDAVEGFDKYVEGAAGVIYYTDAIQKLRALAQQVRYRTSDEGLRERVDAVRELENVSEQDKENRIKEIMEKGRYSLSNFAQELDEYTNLLANKKSKYDRGIESMAGRKVYNLMKAWENRVAANMVAVNPASWLTNFGVITQAGAQLKTTSVLKAMAQTLQSWKTDDGFVDRSDFLTNRRGSDPLVRSLQQNVSATLSKPMDWIDTFSADTIVRARYMENVERGMSTEEAVYEADDFAANVMAERAKGAMPTLFESRNPITKMFTQFQLEVNNTFSYLFKDLPQEQRKKGVGALAMALFKFLIGGYLYNEVYEHFIGRRPMLDPLGILNDTVGDLTGYELNNLLDAAVGGGLIKESEPEGVVGSAENLAGNLGQELPFIGNIMGGGKLPFASSLPDVGNIASAMKSETATTAEKWAKIGKEMANPAAYWLLPFGGGQVKKMWQGIQALKNQGSYTADGRLQYPIYSDRKGDKAGALARTLLFGKSATPEAQAWVEAGFGALSEKATATYEAMRGAGVDQRDSYELIKAMSKVRKTDDATARQLQMQVLRAFDIEDSGKLLYYYGMMANDKEKAEIDRLMAEGADMGEYLRFLDQAAGVTGEKDENGETISGSKKQETLELINGLDMTPEQKTALMESKNYKATGFEPWTENHDKLYSAVSTGKDLRKTLQSLKKDGYDDETLRAAITDLFKEEYLAADRAGRARFKGYLRNAFMVCGLSKKQAETKIDKWTEAKK